jgi:predicted nuclease of predicted toxin-antitoxin system
MISFLADENISPETADFLDALGYPCHSLRRDGPRRLKDGQIVALARQEGRVILTHDLDFGQIYYLAEKGEVGILVLRLRNQTVESVNAVLERFLKSDILNSVDLQQSLVVVSEFWYRVYQGPRGEF